MILPEPRAIATAAIAVAALLGLVLVLTVGGGSSARRPPHHQPRRAAPGPVTISWVGDMSLSSDLGLPPLRGAGPLEGVRGELRASDLALGNLEGALGSGGRSKCRPGSKHCVTFRAPASYARVYARAGFDVLNLANNHSYDFGPKGSAATVRALDRVRIGHAGRAGEVELRRIRRTTVALIGFAPYAWASPLRDLPAARALVGRASRRADVVVVMMHAGAEGADRTHTPHGLERAFGENRGNTRAFAHAAVDAGADLVVGSGPHVVRGLEVYRGRLIAYSLGNFLAYNTLIRGGVLSLSGILRVRLDGSGRPLAARWVSIRLVDPGVPRVDPSGAGGRLVSELSRADFGARGLTVDRRSRVRLPQRR
jgi:hypothetical protein